MLRAAGSLPSSGSVIYVLTHSTFRAQKAAQRGYVAIVKKLLDAGADCEAMDNNGQTALDWAKEYEGQGGDGVRLTISVLEEWEKKHST